MYFSYWKPKIAPSNHAQEVRSLFWAVTESRCILWMDSNYLNKICPTLSQKVSSTYRNRQTRHIDDDENQRTPALPVPQTTAKGFNNTDWKFCTEEIKEEMFSRILTAFLEESPNSWFSVTQYYDNSPCRKPKPLHQFYSSSDKALLPTTTREK